MKIGDGVRGWPPLNPIPETFQSLSTNVESDTTDCWLGYLSVKGKFTEPSSGL